MRGFETISPNVIPVYSLKLFCPSFQYRVDTLSIVIEKIIIKFYRDKVFLWLKFPKIFLYLFALYVLYLKLTQLNIVDIAHMLLPVPVHLHRTTMSSADRER